MNKLAGLVLAGALLFSVPPAFAAADVASLYADAVLNADVEVLEKLLAPNFVYIGPDGHINDKSHYLESFKTGELSVKNMNLKNMRESLAGTVRVITGNGRFTTAEHATVPSGWMRITVVSERVKSRERIVLVQLTPVIPTKDCKDGNCRIR